MNRYNSYFQTEMYRGREVVSHFSCTSPFHVRLSFVICTSTFSGLCAAWFHFEAEIGSQSICFFFIRPKFLLV